MKIIKKGTLLKEKEYDCICRRCKTVFSFKQSEAELVYDSRDGDYLIVICPVCKKQNTVDA